MANRTENVGIFTAYGFAREGGYVGTKAEFEEGLAKSANYATNAQASATAAANSATAASGSATAAAGSASTAAGYAQDADEFAQAAAASADEAEEYAESIDPDQFAKIDGYYGTLKSGESDTADNLTSHSADSGTSQNTPFILQGTACANGEEQADTGSYCQLQRKNGNTVTVNQPIQNPNFSDATAYWQKYLLTATVGSGEVLLTNTDTNGSIFQDIPTSNHKYLIITEVKCGTANKVHFYFGGIIYTTTTSTSYTVLMAIADGSTTRNRFQIMCEGESGATAYIKYGYAIDLTLWFGSNDKIPTHLLNHPENFFRYYQGDLSYNVGTLTDCNGRYLKTWGRNIFAANWTQNVWISNTNGSVVSFDGRCVDETYYRVAPNTAYFAKRKGSTSLYDICIAEYDKDKNFIASRGIPGRNNDAFAVSSETIYIRVGTPMIPTAQDEYTISLYYPDESGYDQTSPYEELANIDTGDEVLRSAGSVCDVKVPSGEITRNVGNVADMSGLEWQILAESGYVLFYVALDGLTAGTGIDCIMPRYTNSGNTTWANQPDKTYQTYQGNIYIKDLSYNDATSFAASLSGVSVNYPLATPTTEQGTPFAENVAIDDFGSMAFDCPNGVPQGNLIFYPVDYKAEIDTLHNITEGDMHKLALKGDLAEGEPETIEEVVDYINARIPAPPAEDGTYNLTVTVASGEATYSWVSAT